MSAASELSFPDDLTERIDSMSPAELDCLPHGAIQLDRDGKVLAFNEYESRLSLLPKNQVIGKNFFTDVAPCTRVQEFHGRFLRGVAERRLHEKFRYFFAFKHQPRSVLVTLFYSDKTDSVWVFIRAMDAAS